MKLNLTILEKGEETHHKIDRCENLLKFLKSVDVSLVAPCSGNGTCGKCRGKFAFPNPPNETDKKFLTREELEAGIRLLCTYEMSKNEVLTLSQKTVDILSSFEGNVANPDCYIFATKDFLTVGDEQFKLTQPVSKNDEVLVIDVGTTTIAANLVSLTTGEILKELKCANPQKIFGSDVISRIENSKTPGTLEKMQRQLAIEISKMCKSAKIEKVPLAIFLGNSTMERIAQNLPITPLGVFPFTLDQKDELIKSGEELGFDFTHYALFLPLISAYVGGDIVSGIVSLQNETGNILLVDLGTNGEMALISNGKITTSATAAGPCFEGGNLECGMMATEGGVTDVWLENGKLNFSSMGEPKGLCGSGALSFLSQLLTASAIDETGRLQKDSPFVKGDKAHLTDEIYLSQKDIRELQLAKSAISAGIAILTKDVKLDKLILGGALGKSISREIFSRVGLIPKNLEKITEAHGNTALKGGINYTLNIKSRKYGQTVSEMAENKNLAEQEEFADLFVEGMFFNV